MQPPVVRQLLQQPRDVVGQVVDPGVELPALLGRRVQEVLADPVVDRRFLVELVAQQGAQRLRLLVGCTGVLRTLKTRLLVPS